jgi:hypothetical protein
MLRARGREVFAGSITSADVTGGIVSADVPLGLTVVGLAAFLVGGYYYQSEVIARGIRRSGALPAPSGGAAGSSLRAYVRRVPWAGGHRYAVIGGQGNIERTLPDNPEGRARAERAAAHLNSLDEILPGGERPRREGRPRSSAGTASPPGVARPWRRSGRITGIQG